MIDEDPAKVFRNLVHDEKRMTFLPVPVPGSGNEPGSPGQPEDDPDHLTDLRLQTAYTSAQLQSRLLATYHAAHTSMEEQGVNTLYLALGMLCWTEQDQSEKSCNAPLILIPVELERSDARDRFHLKYTGEEIGENVSLAEKLKVEFGFKSFPELPDSDDLDVRYYFYQIERLIRRQAKWTVETNSMVLGFFSFSKLLMYRDLDPATWTEASALLGHEVLQKLLGDAGLERRDSRYTEDQLLDEQLREHPPVQVVDADSTQTVAILDALDGQNMIIQGPPGTGKSQTIVNLISAAVAEGKKVLFVSEKMAALDVVKRRLDAVGLSGPCLELHSNRSNKKTVLGELKLTVCRNVAPMSRSRGETERLADYRDRLNAYCKAVNEPIANTGETPISAYGRMLEAASDLQGIDLPGLTLDAGQWSTSEVARYRDLVVRLQERLGRTGVPVRHPYWGCGLLVLLPTDRDEVARWTSGAIQRLDDLEHTTGSLAEMCKTASPRCLKDTELLADSANFFASAPELGDIDPSNPAWLGREAEIAEVLQAGKEHREILRRHAAMLRPEVWGRDVDGLRCEIADLGLRWWRFLSRRWGQLKQEIQFMCVGRGPRDRSGMLALLDAILGASRSGRTVTDADSSMLALFRSSWCQLDSDWDLLERQASWILAGQRKVRSGSYRLVPQGKHGVSGPCETSTGRG